MVIRTVIRLGLVLGALYLIPCLLVMLFQRRLLYFPERHTEAEAAPWARARGLTPWRDAQGGLLGWRRAGGPQAAVRVLVFHGNAGSALDREAYAGLFDPAGFEVVLFEYPGYGPRGGACTERSLVASATEAFDLLRREGPVLLLGESLGSGVAVQVAATKGNAVAGLLLVTPFARITEVAARHYPWLPVRWLPVRWLLLDRWDSLSRAAQVTCPVGLVIAGRDEVVGAVQGYRLAEGFSAPVKIGVQPQARHNTLVLDSLSAPWPEVLGFLTGETEPPGDAKLSP